jgi:hypothetical protein
MIVETWFNNKRLDSDFNLNGFILFRRDRMRSKGGGLCVYVRDSISSSVDQPDVV